MLIITVLDFGVKRIELILIQLIYKFQESIQSMTQEITEDSYSSWFVSFLFGMEKTIVTE
jgi:hypothetical protein